MTVLFYPAIGSQWKHTNGNIYQVYDYTNEDSERQNDYPVTISYINIHNGKKWSRSLERWYSGSLTEQSERIETDYTNISVKL